MRVEGFRSFVVTRKIYEATDHDRRLHARMMRRIHFGVSEGLIQWKHYFSSLRREKKDA